MTGDANTNSVGLTANISNFVRQEIRVPKSKPLLPVFEAVSNALDAIADRPGSGTVRVIIHRTRDMLEEKRGNPHSFVIEDDGIGFDHDNIGGFDELYSARKAERGGKGRGRFTYLKVFARAEISSTFAEDGQLATRVFNFDLSYSGFKGKPAKSGVKLGSSVRLCDMRTDYAALIPKEASTIAREFISHFLPILLSDKKIEIILVDGEEIKLAERVRRELLIEQQKVPFEIGKSSFTVHTVKLKTSVNLRHRIILAASSREVHGDNLEKWIPVLSTGPLFDPASQEGFWYIAIVEGAFLDNTVDPMRVTFTDEDDAAGEQNEETIEPLLATTDLFGEPQSIKEVRKEALKIVKYQLEKYILSAVQHRTTAIESYIQRDGMGYHFLKSEIGEIARSLKTTDNQAIETQLHAAAYVERRKRSKQAQQLLDATPKEKSEDGYFDRWSNVVDRLSDVAKSDLANHVAHRRIILDLVEDILKTTPEGTYRREKVLHNIVFPMGRQTGEVGYEQQNLWLIDERLSFHEHLFSDISIGSITADEEDSLRRPDLAIYESGFASFHDGAKPPSQLVLVELKQPGRTNTAKDDPVSKTLLYVKELKRGNAKTEGNAVIDIEPDALTTVYILADWTANFRAYLEREDFDVMPGDIGRYKWRPKEKIMFIAMSFDRLVESARRRNKIFFRKLGIDQA